MEPVTDWAAAFCANPLVSSKPAKISGGYIEKRFRQGNLRLVLAVRDRFIAFDLP
jgi:hypothetical protein